MVVALLLSVPSVWATNVHLCEDESGNKTFQKHCPPGSVSVSSKNYSDGKQQAEEKELPALVMYAIPECDVCDQMRKHLSANNLQVTEKNIEGNGELQQELKSKTGGELRVPILLVGEKVVAGYDEYNVNTALKEAGYEVKEMAAITGPETAQAE